MPGGARLRSPPAEFTAVHSGHRCARVRARLLRRGIVAAARRAQRVRMYAPPAGSIPRCAVAQPRQAVVSTSQSPTPRDVQKQGAINVTTPMPSSIVMPNVRNAGVALTPSSPNESSVLAADRATASHAL